MNKLKLDRNIPIVPRWRENLKEASMNVLKWMIDRQLFWYCLFIFTNKFMNTTFMHLSIQLAQIRKFRIRRTFHFLDILGPAVEWSEIKVFSECRQNKYNERGIVEKQFQQRENINKKICHYFALLFISDLNLKIKV